MSMAMPQVDALAGKLVICVAPSQLEMFLPHYKVAWRQKPSNHNSLGNIRSATGHSPSNREQWLSGNAAVRHCG